MARKTERFLKHYASANQGMHISNGDSLGGIKGEIFWELTDSITGETTSGHYNNVVTLDAGILVARLLKSTMVANVSEPKFGIYSLAVGTGDVGWNPMSPPPANNAQRSLFNEIARKAAASSQFIDSNGMVSGVPTNIVDFNFTFSNAEAVGPLTEMGLIGGDLSTNMAVRNPVMPPNGPYDPTANLVGKDSLVNYLTFPVINKPPTSSLSWVWRITT